MPLHKNTLVYVLIILVFYSYVNLQAQTNALTFKHISYKEGLSQSPIFSMIQDRKGFVWIGTSDGLLRYDGYEFKTYQHDDSNDRSISTNRIQSIFEDSKARLWIGTANGGLNLFDRKTETFQAIAGAKETISTDYITSFLEDSKGKLWVTTLRGLKIIDAKAKRLKSVHALQKHKGIFSGKTWSLFQDEHKAVWVGLNFGLAKFDVKSNKVLTLPVVLENDKALMESRILVIRGDNEGNVLFGTEKSGLFIYDIKSNSCVNYRHDDSDLNSLPSNGIKDILINADQTIWIATREGLAVLDQNRKTLTNYKHNISEPNSLSYNLLWHFMKDKAGNIWIGNFAGGIDIYYPGNSNFINIGERVGNEKLGLNNPVVTSIIEDVNNALWIGTNGGGLNYADRKKGISKSYSVRDNELNKANNIIRSLAHDQHNNLWVGTFDGLFRFNKNTGSFKYIRLANAQDNRVIALLSDPKGIWVATITGGLQFIGYTGESEIYKSSIKNRNSLGDNNITVLLRDAENNILIGTENGLNYFNTKRRLFRRYVKGKGSFMLSNNSILSVFQDSKRRIWIGTEGGLNYFDPQQNKFYRLKLNSGTANDIVLAIVEDNSGHLWVNTNKGISEITIKSFQLPLQASNFKIINYKATSGLSSTHFLGAAIKKRNGELLFGGMSGITSFIPDRIFKNQYKPDVVITDFLIESKLVTAQTVNSPLSQSITETKEITLKHNQNYISFKYAGLNFINPENNQYAYKLKGFSGHQDWSYVGNQRIASFTNLEPGDYVFTVKAANNDGVWNDKETQIKIKVLPPMWKTWWAYLLYLTASGALLFMILRFVRNRAILKRDLYLEHVHNERQQELYQLKINFFTNISHEIRTPLTLIIGPLERILQNANYEGVHKQLGVVKSNADRLMKLITELLDFRKAEEGHMKIHCSFQNVVPFCARIYQSFTDLATEKNITYQFLTDSDTVMLYFDPDQIEKVVVNLLSNAFKFTDHNGEISLSITSQTADRRWVNISVTDNGEGIPQDIHEKLFESFFQADDRGRQNIGSGIGLALSKSIIALHKGEIKVLSDTEDHSLTTFIISLPRGDQHVVESGGLSEKIYHEELQQVSAPDKKSYTIERKETLGSKEKKYTILIVEDNEEVRALIVGDLIDSYHVIEFGNGLDALNFMKDEIPDLIVSDVMMPGMDGFELCQIIKSTESTNHIPVILLTAMASLTHQIEGLSTGANAYISKPFSPQVLALHMKNLLASQEAMRQKFSQQLVLESGIIEVESPEHKFISKLMTCIEMNMHDPDFGVESLVNEMGMSRTVLYKKVQTLTNFSIADLVKNVRLKKAALLFSKTSLPIAEVAYEVGFNDRKYFSREFRKFFTISPSDYIKKVREQL